MNNIVIIYLTIHLAHCAPPTHPSLIFLKVFLHAIFFPPSLLQRADKITYRTLGKAAKRLNYSPRLPINQFYVTIPACMN